MKTAATLFTLTVLFFSSPLLAGVSHLLHKSTYDNCNITISHDAVEGHNGVIIIRSTTNNQTLCPLPKELLSANLDQAIKTLKANKSLAEVSSVFLSGKLRAFNWMSEYLVKTSETSKEWDIALRKPVTGSPNNYVNTMLYTNKLLKPFSAPLNKHGYEITGVSCEKVRINRDGLPYEAMCWLSIIRSD